MRVATTCSRSTIGRALVAGFIAAGTVWVSAHMALKKSEPAANAVLTAPPSHVQLYFSEVPDIKVSKLEVKGPSPKTTFAKPHVLDKERALAADVQGEMPDGAYTVQWQTAGDDGHVQKGELAFSVKRK